MALAARGTCSLDLRPTVGLGQVPPLLLPLLPYSQPIIMKSGAIKIITEEGQGISNDAAPIERHEQGETLRSSVQLSNSHAQSTLDFTVEDGEMSGTAINEGKILREELIEFKNRRLDQDGRPVIDDEGTERSIEETNFIHVSEQVLITDRTECESACSVFEAASGSNTEPATIDIKSFDDAHPDAESRLEWGDDREGEYGPICLVADEGQNLPENRRTDPDKRVQFTFDHLDWEERDLYGTITASGYIELYRDQNGRGQISTEEFTRFVVEEVLPHSRVDS